MTKEEYSAKWCGECMHCGDLMLRKYDDEFCDSEGKRMTHGSWVFCLWAKGRMEAMPDESTCEEMTKKMVLDEDNIWIGCHTYTERIVELYNLED